MLSRDAETSALKKVLASAVSGLGASLLLEGGVGSGKSVLVRAALRFARDAGFEVVSTRARQAEQSLPGSLLDQVHDQLRTAAGASPERDRIRTAADAVPECEPDGAPEQDDTCAQIHRMHQLVTALASRRPVLITVDDLQWTDQDSLQWLAHLMARLDGLPVALVAALAYGYTKPKPHTPPRHPGASSLAGVASDFHRRMVIRNLDADSVAYLMSTAFGEPVHSETALALYRSTAGNPFLVHAVLREISHNRGDAPHPDAADISVLGSVEIAEMFAARCAWIPGVGKVLDAVAVLDRSARAPLVADIAEIPDTAAADMLQMLTRWGVLHDHPTGVGFAQPVVRESFLIAMPPSDRARLHTTSAAALHNQAAPAEQITGHLLRAAPSDQPWAHRMLTEAADDALARGAYTEAGACLRRALEGTGPEPGVLRRLGQVELADDPVAAAARFRQALHLMRADDQAWGQVLAELVQALVLAGDISEALRTAHRAAADLERAETAGETGPARDAGRGAGAIRDLLVLLDSREVPGGPRTSSPPRPVPAPDPSSRAPWVRLTEYALAAVHAQQSGTRRKEAVHYARLGLGEPLDPAGPRTALRLQLALVLSHAGEHAEALKACRTLGDELPPRAHALSTLAGAVRAECAYHAGHLREAVDTAYEALERGGDQEWLGSLQARWWLGGTLFDLGNPKGAGRLLLDSGPADRTPDMALPALLFHRGRLHCAQGRTEAGLADLEECGRRLDTLGWADSVRYPWRSAAALAHAELGRTDVAGQLAEEELALARNWGAAHTIGGALRVLGVLTPGKGRGELLAEAATILNDSGATVEEARVLRDLGRELMRTRRTREAREQLRAALALAERSGAGMLVEELRRDLMEAGAKPRRETEIGPESLTPAERRAALLAAEGLTNKEIALRLFVTRRTVEMHLSRVYRKLSISDRRHLSTAVGAACLPDSPPEPTRTCTVGSDHTCRRKAA
ncbi:AAA family ATPase [Streptomyces sp. B-S-A8]|uniref:AAA family ATPase n=1 Tax=Streptomyces solicavernae TaxID=3043614 RepID=A0ABT6RYR0_9ACTN|nr:LuxR family transcriptional regulator [Streptomyces sp. B-S-A8]MDI3389582.1 AAA family ATPase [Streptomyces sp. B-S-A8]